jgi:hypothetical protein
LQGDHCRRAMSASLSQRDVGLAQRSD